ncbi:MAG: heat-inducible transcriptional repressor HrcA [Actinomycetes bacterium]
MMQERQLEILRAIVDEYVATEEPVGSKIIAQRHSLGVSPATIRNEMAILEEAGLITQPHTSAGRIPTNLGYRVFVDKLTDVKPLSTPERKAIETFLEGALDLDDIVTRTVKLLAQITKQVAVVQYPSLTKSRVRHLELVLLHPSRAMLILITDTGRVEQRIIELPFDISEASLAVLHGQINSAIVGHPLSSVASQVDGIISAFSELERNSVAVIIASLIEVAVERSEEKVALAGTANLARSNPEFTQTIHPILEALEEQVVLLRLLADAGSSVQVRIGDEQNEKSLISTSLVTMGYGSNDASAGALGILGPTRMDYASSMAAVHAVARYIGHFLNEAH